MDFVSPSRQNTYRSTVALAITKEYLNNSVDSSLLFPQLSSCFRVRTMDRATMISTFPRSNAETHHTEEELLYDDDDTIDGSINEVLLDLETQGRAPADPTDVGIDWQNQMNLASSTYDAGIGTSERDDDSSECTEVRVPARIVKTSFH